MRTGERRLGRRARRRAEGEATVDLGTEEHAWWAGRATLEHGIPGYSSGGDPGTPDERHEWDTDWLYTGGTVENEPVQSPPSDAAVPAMDLSRASQVLGVAIGAAWEEITAAHRHLAKRHHPDRLPPTASDEERQRASDRMASVNVALDILRQRVGPDAPVTVDDLLHG